MKLALWMSCLLAAGCLCAQISSVTRRTLQAPRAITVVRPANTQPSLPPAILVVPPAAPAPVALPPSPPKTPAEKAAELKRVIAFQKKCAEEGKAGFQYALGERYLAGDGVEQDLETARKWLAAAAKQGDSKARKKLEELDKAQADPAPAK